MVRSRALAERGLRSEPNVSGEDGREASRGTGGDGRENRSFGLKRKVGLSNYGASTLAPLPRRHPKKRCGVKGADTLPWSARTRRGPQITSRPTSLTDPPSTVLLRVPAGGAPGANDSPPVSARPVPRGVPPRPPPGRAGTEEGSEGEGAGRALRGAGDPPPPRSRLRRRGPQREEGGGGVSDRAGPERRVQGNPEVFGPPKRV